MFVNTYVTNGALYISIWLVLVDPPPFDKYNVLFDVSTLIPHGSILTLGIPADVALKNAVYLLVLLLQTEYNNGVVPFVVTKITLPLDANPIVLASDGRFSVINVILV